MKSYLKDLWAKAMLKLGAVASFVPAIAAQINVALDAGDAAKLRAHAVELKEAGQAQIDLGDALLIATEDGTLDLVEGSEIALKIERMLDELEDVAKGYDEDDVAAVE